MKHRRVSEFRQTNPDEGERKPLPMTDRKQPGVAFWATVVVVGMMVAYPLSFGLAIWFYERDLVPDWADKFVSPVFWPFDWVMANAPKPLRAPLLWWYLWWKQ